MGETASLFLALNSREDVQVGNLNTELRYGEKVASASYAIPSKGVEPFSHILSILQALRSCGIHTSETHSVQHM